jgi:hypothetical protein
MKNILFVVTTLIILCVSCGPQNQTSIQSTSYPGITNEPTIVARPQSSGIAIANTIESPTTEASESPSVGVEITQNIIYRVSESLPNNKFIGLVKNTGNSPISTQVEVTLWDKDNNSILSIKERTVYDVILPGEITLINLTLGDYDWDHYTVKLVNTQIAHPDTSGRFVEGYNVDPKFYRDFTISNVQYTDDCDIWSGGCVTGEIRNSGKIPVYCPGVAIVVLDDKQNMIGVTAGPKNNSYIIDKWNELIDKLYENGPDENIYFEPLMPNEVSTFTIPVELFTNNKPKDFLVFPDWNWGGCPWGG